MFFHTLNRNIWSETIFVLAGGIIVWGAVLSSFSLL